MTRYGLFARVMPKHRWGLLSLLLACFGGNVYSQQEISPGQTFKQVLKQGQKIGINLMTGGDIEIMGSNEQTLSFNYEVKSSSSPVVMTLKPIDSQLTLTSDFQTAAKSTRCSMVLRMQVPNTCLVDLKTQGGDLSIRDFTGRVQGTTMGGAIAVTKMNGDLSLTTMGGDIDIIESRLEGSAHTMGGNVTLKNMVGGLKATTLAGEISYHDKTAVSSEKPSVELISFSGDLNVERAPNGATLRTSGGDIEVGYAKYFANVSTEGGDIDIKAVDGDVYAQTMGGSIKVRVLKPTAAAPRTIELASMQGDLVLELPTLFPMELEIALAVTKGNEGKFKVRSDFPIDLKTDEDWDTTKGDPRKFTRGKAAFGDGLTKIKLSTVNGNVTLKSKTKTIE